MSDNENTHVARLNRYLPFSPSHDQIYEEYQQTENSLKLETRAIEYTLKMIDKGAKMLVLTGDAGHGKTHICRRMLEDHLGYSQKEARLLLSTKCNGKAVIDHKDELDTVRGLRIFKDFSELPPAAAFQRLEELGAPSNEVTIICANEGRLRTVLESATPNSFCASLSADFTSSFKSGLASHNSITHIINLNYQSVSAPYESKRSLIIETLHQWTSGTRWRACSNCDSKSACPIRNNQMMLSDHSDQLASIRRKNIELIFSTTERLGTVVTIREMLMTVAYLLTSGLSCKDVHVKRKKSPLGWQHPYAYYNCLFALPPDLSTDKLTRIPLLSSLSRLDPGLIANRSVDEQVLNHNDVFPEGTIDLCFPDSIEDGSDTIDVANGIDDIIGNPRNSKERQREGNFIRSVVRCLRRRAFFDEISKNENPIERLGFAEGGKFLEIVSGQLKKKRAGELKRHLIAGLHTIQGLHFNEQQSELRLVDPAFGDATSHAAIIATSVPAQDISLIPLSEKWSIEDDSEIYSLSSSVDWLDRHVVLRIISVDLDVEDLVLDLVSFDCIVRAGGGYVAEEFYAHDIRRIVSFLGRLAETRKSSSDVIDLIIEGTSRSISIDNDYIEVTGGV